VADPACVALEWASELEGRGVMLAGNGLRKYAAVFAEALGPQAEVLPEQAWHPGGRGVLRAFGEALRAGAAGDGEPGSLLPIYTRLSDAEEGERIRAGRAGSAPPRSGVNGAPEPGPRPEGGSR
jgi:N6-L-threonylcarbamoyladenine synthase/protein kinase Bud32